MQENAGNQKTRKKKSRYHRGEYLSTKTGKLCKYRSGWEHKFMMYLDACEQVVSWNYELLIIEYLSNKKTGKTKKYYPDFSVTYQDGTLKVIEIKQHRKLTQVTVIKKAVAAREWCRNHGAIYEILTEHELKSLGVL